MPSGNETYLGDIDISVPNKEIEGTNDLDNYSREIRRTFKNSFTKGVFGEHHPTGKHKFFVGNQTDRLSYIDPQEGQLCFDVEARAIYRYTSSGAWEKLPLETEDSHNFIWTPGTFIVNTVVAQLVALCPIWLPKGTYEFDPRVYVAALTGLPLPTGSNITFSVGSQSDTQTVPAASGWVTFATLTLIVSEDQWVDVSVTASSTISKGYGMLSDFVRRRV